MHVLFNYLAASGASTVIRRRWMMLHRALETLARVCNSYYDICTPLFIFCLEHNVKEAKESKTRLVKGR